MDLSQLALWISLAFCLAMTTGGTLLLFRAKRLNRLPAFKYLQYSLILIYTFGFYSLWSQILFPKLSLAIQKTTADYIMDAVFVMGTPFLLFGLLLQLAWSYHCIVISLPKKILSFIIVPAGFILFIYFLLTDLWGITTVYSSTALLISSATLLILLLGKLDIMRGRWKLALLTALFLGTGIYAANFQSWFVGEYFQLLFVFLYFLTNTAVAVIFIYTAIVDESKGILSFQDFVTKFQITKRESEIIREIYNGKSNQEIADHLFVTLQTVKDHTSRIYQKAQVKSRVQMIALLREYKPE